MLLATKRGVFHTQRLIGAVLLVAVFVLPLHLHPVNPLPLVNKDCTCYSGARAQLGLPEAETSLAPVIQASPVDVLEVFYLVSHLIHSHSGRAPPSL